MQRVVLGLVERRVRLHAIISAQDVVVILPALAAELDRDGQPPAARLELAVERELAHIGRFQRGVKVSALADELVKLIGKGASALGAL